jgi:hypothetical protein
VEWARNKAFFSMLVGTRNKIFVRAVREKEKE